MPSTIGTNWQRETAERIVGRYFGYGGAAPEAATKVAIEAMQAQQAESEMLMQAEVAGAVLARQEAERQATEWERLHTETRLALVEAERQRDEAVALLRGIVEHLDRVQVPVTDFDLRRKMAALLAAMEVSSSPSDETSGGPDHE